MGKGGNKGKGNRGNNGSSSSGGGISKKSKRGANRGGGGHGANFAEVCVRQKNSTQMKREATARLMKVRAMGRKIKASEDALRRYVTDPKLKIVKGYDPALRGMELTGPARPAIDVELSDHGCGLRLFECRKRCIREEDRPIEIDLFAKMTEQGQFMKHEATKQHIQLLQEAGDACREGDHIKPAIKHFERGLRLDATDAFALRPRLVALLMDSGDAAQARSLIPEDTRNVTYQWTLFLVEYISHYLLKETESSPQVVMHALEKAMSCNPHVGLFLAMPNVFEEVVDANTLIQDINSHHHLYNPDKSNDAEVEGVGSSDGGGGSGNHVKPTTDGVTEVTAALAYAIDQFGCWRDAGNDEGDVRNFVYQHVVHEHYEPVENIKSHDMVSPVRLVRATYGEFVLRLNAARSEAKDIAEEDDFKSSGEEDEEMDMDEFEKFAK